MKARYYWISALISIAACPLVFSVGGFVFSGEAYIFWALYTAPPVVFLGIPSAYIIHSITKNFKNRMMESVLYLVFSFAGTFLFFILFSEGNIIKGDLVKNFISMSPFYLYGYLCALTFQITSNLLRKRWIKKPAKEPGPTPDK